MNFKIVSLSLIIAIIIISSATIFSEQQIKSKTDFQTYTEKFNKGEWNEGLVKNLPIPTELGEEWTLLWSDGSKEYIPGENPTIIKKIVAGNEIISTSYNYSHKNYGTYQIIIWKGELVSNWIPRDAIDQIFLQTDAKTERILEGLDLIPNCLVAYYDYYGEESEIENNLLFAECAKNDFRIRINLVEGEFNQKSVEQIVFLSNLVVGKI